MEIRLAENKDLPELKTMFSQIVENMSKNNIKIWNEYYPFEEFESDIKNKNLYVLIEQNEIVAVFGLFETTGGSDNFEWQKPSAKALYLARVGVNTKHLRKGYGKLSLTHAKQISKQKGCDYLRLMVADINTPAVSLYKQNGFTQVAGKYIEYSPTLNANITEFGYEIKL